MSIHVAPLEYFNELSTRPADVAHPVMFFAEEAPLDSLPLMVPYAVIGAAAGTEVGRVGVAQRMWQKAAELNADILIVEYAGAAYAGSVSQYWGYGIATATPVYNNTYRGYCYKRAAIRFGLRFNKEGMLLACSDEAREAGIIEGDTLLSINGLPILEEGRTSPPYYKLALNARAGEEMRLIWIRPGEGRMEGTMKALDNPPTHIGLSSSIPWKPPATPPRP